ncbi:hypothetical protein JHK86_001269 [Glycine max]|nr:hypothetical protein JHK86_001269 [Glycine max]
MSEYHSSMIFLLETHLSGPNAKRTIKHIRLENREDTQPLNLKCISTKRFEVERKVNIQLERWLLRYLLAQVARQDLPQLLFNSLYTMGPQQQQQA